MNSYPTQPIKSRRSFLRQSVHSALGSSFLASVASAYAAPVKPHSFTMLVNEGETYRPDSESDIGFTALANDIGKSLGGTVKWTRARDYKELKTMLAEGTYDLAYVHPAHHAINALQSKKYELAALSKSHMDYRGKFMVRTDSKTDSLAALVGKAVQLPSQDSITAWMTRATLVEMLGAGKPMPRLGYSRYQDSIRFIVENRLAEAGVTASGAEIKEWLAAGHKLLSVQTRAVPIKQWLVSPRLGSSGMSAVQEVLFAQQNTQRFSAPSGFVGFDQAALLASWEWLSQGVPLG